MARARILVSIASAEWSFVAQEEVVIGTEFRTANETHPGEIPAAVAAVWCTVGHAVAIDEPAAPVAAPVIETAAVEAPETATLRPARTRRG